MSQLKKNKNGATISFPEGLEDTPYKVTLNKTILFWNIYYLDCPTIDT